MKKEGDHTYSLRLAVRNRPGVLVRCAQVFGRRGHNIESLEVAGDANNTDRSTMTITAYGKPEMMNQIAAQLTKLVDVIEVQESEV